MKFFFVIIFFSCLLTNVHAQEATEVTISRAWELLDKKESKKALQTVAHVKFDYSIDYWVSLIRSRSFAQQMESSARAGRNKELMQLGNRALAEYGDLLLHYPLLSNWKSVTDEITSVQLRLGEYYAKAGNRTG